MRGGMISRDTTRFLSWVDEVERIVYARIHVGLLDLPDEDYMVHFENNTPPEIMAQRIIKDFNACSLFLGINKNKQDDVCDV
jgi:hypothetical protein